MPESITDSEILEWLNKELLIIKYPELIIFKYHSGRKKYRKLGKSVHPYSGRVRIVLGTGTKNTGTQRRRTIYRNRLVWMDQNRMVIPEGLMVNHINGNCEDDSPENLCLHGAYESHKQGADVQTELNYQSWYNFLNYIQFMGHEPPADSYLWS